MIKFLKLCLTLVMISASVFVPNSLMAADEGCGPVYEQCLAAYPDNESQQNECLRAGGCYTEEVTVTASSGGTTFSSIVNYLVSNILAPIVPLLAGVALLLFLFGLAVFILNSENAEKAQSGRTYMFWGVIALFVMTSLWGLVRFLGDTFEDVIPNTSNIQDVDILKRDIFP